MTNPKNPPLSDQPGAVSTDARARETALREILEVISANRGDELPVFEVIVHNAARLCDAQIAAMHIVNEARTHTRLVCAWGQDHSAFPIGEEFDLGVSMAVGAAINEARVVHIADTTKDPQYLAGNLLRLRMVEEEGIRTFLVVPLVRNGVAFGCINLSRRKVQPFAEDEIELVRTFAEQAVIAIENVRQFRELQTRLEREEATREILEAISQSRDDEAPVFDMILGHARRLCDAPFAALVLARPGDAHQNMVAHHGAKDSTVEIYRTGGVPMDPERSFAAQAIYGQKVVHLRDMADTDEYRAGIKNVASLVDLQGIRTNLFVPLITSSGGIGCFILFRHDVRPFDANQIALVETFAAQAVIAIENVRQFREVQTRLEREAAMRDVLQVISQSRTDEQPVFETIVQNAARLCGSPAGVGLHLLNDVCTHSRLVCSWGPDVGVFPIGTEYDVSNTLPQSIAMREARVIHTPNLAQSPLYLAGDEEIVKKVDEEGVSTFLCVPLLKDGAAIGCFNLNRYDLKPYSEAEISLAETFAEQAVIAIENVRQFRELQDRLEREKATREILQVISQSRTDEAPVFDAILSNAQRLCGAPFGFLNMVTEDGEHLEIMADGTEPFEPFRTGWRWPVNSKLLLARSVRERAVLQLEDVALDPLYAQGNEDRVTVVKAGVRTVLAVPLVSDGLGIGSIALFRREPRPFAPDEIALVQTFAEQAVIAIENVRQFKALEDRTTEVVALNSDLEDRVEAQVSQLERLGRLRRFLSPQVADAVVSSGDDSLLGSHRAMIAILFCDIRGFTAFCESAEPEETIEVLQTFHETLGKLIHEAGAGFDHRAGDGIMVVFNDPVPCDDPAGAALRVAIAMRERMVELCGKWRKLGHRMGFGVGISLGYATVGMVGFEGRFDYTASGTAVNLAARLCDQAADQEILLSARAATALDNIADVDSAGELTLKGFHAPVDAFRVTGMKETQ